MRGGDSAGGHGENRRAEFWATGRKVRGARVDRRAGAFAALSGQGRSTNRDRARREREC